MICAGARRARGFASRHFRAIWKRTIPDRCTVAFISLEMAWSKPLARHGSGANHLSSFPGNCPLPTFRSNKTFILLWRLSLKNISVTSRTTLLHATKNSKRLALSIALLFSLRFHFAKQSLHCSHAPRIQLEFSLNSLSALRYNTIFKGNDFAW